MKPNRLIEVSSYFPSDVDKSEVVERNMETRSAPVSNVNISCLLAFTFSSNNWIGPALQN